MKYSVGAVVLFAVAACSAVSVDASPEHEATTPTVSASANRRPSTTGGSLERSTAATPSARAAGGCPGEADYVCGEIIVGLYDNLDVTIEEVVERNGGNEDDILSRMDGIGAYVIAVEPGSEAAAIEEYLEDPDVEYVDYNGTAGAVPATPAP